MSGVLCDVDGIFEAEEEHGEQRHHAGGPLQGVLSLGVSPVDVRCRQGTQGELTGCCVWHSKKQVPRHHRSPPTFSRLSPFLGPHH